MDWNDQKYAEIWRQGWADTATTEIYTGEDTFPYTTLFRSCNLFTDTPSVYVGEGNFPRVMQDGRDGDEEVGYIANITDSTTIGFKYFDCHDIREISIWTRGYADGTFEVKTAWDGEVLASLEVQYTNVWEKYTAPVTIPDGIQALYLTYRGNGNAALRSFELS